MSKTIVSGLFCALAVYAQQKELPRHSFRPDSALTEPSGDSRRAIADRYSLNAISGTGLGAADWAGAYVVKEYVTGHNGVTHFVYGQRFDSIEVVEAAWVVNIDSDGRVINSGG